MPNQVDTFIETIARLRAPDGCPWDREQTHLSLARYLLEETYEVLEAIHSEDRKKLREELGDLLLQIVLNAQVAKDEGTFDIQDVARGINEKMIKRHPHVFSNVSVENAGQVKKNWEELKEEERKSKAGESCFSGIPRAMPALLQALKVSEKAVALGFEWRNEGEVWDKLESEMTELKEAIANPEMQNPDKAPAAKREIELELGDILFCLVNVSRWHGVNPEEALLLSTEKFKTRFEEMERLSQQPLKELSKDEYAELWKRAKLSADSQSSKV